MEIGFWECQPITSWQRTDGKEKEEKWWKRNKRKGEEGTLALLGNVFSLKFLYQYLLKEVVPPVRVFVLLVTGLCTINWGVVFYSVPCGSGNIVVICS